MLKINNLRVELHTSVYPNNEDMLRRVAETMLQASGGKGSIKSVNGYSATVDIIIKSKELPSSITVNGALQTAIMAELRSLDTSNFSPEALDDLSQVMENPNLCGALYYITYTRLNNAWDVAIRF